MTKKRFAYKIYNTTVNWDEAYWDLDHYDYNASQSWEGDVISEPTFRTTINSGAGECIVKLVRDFDSFGEDVDVILDRQVDIFVYDNEATNGQLLYRGFISGYAPILDNDKEYLEVTLVGYNAELSWKILQDSSGNTGLSYLSKDPSNIFRDIIDKYREQGGILTYDASSIQDTGTTVSYTFNLVTIKDALDKVLNLCPLKWYYYVDPNGKIYLKGPSGVIDHKLYVGKNITSMRPQKRSEDVRNEIYFVGGTPAGQDQLFRKYTRPASITSYGRRSDIIQDQRVTVNATADLISTRSLDYNESPIVRTELEVADNNGENQFKGYDIESIKVGQNITVNNLKSSARDITQWDIAEFDVDKWDYLTNFITADILQINSLTYSSNSIIIEAAARLPDVAKRIEDIERNLDSLALATIPVTPTDT